MEYSRAITAYSDNKYPDNTINQNSHQDDDVSSAVEQINLIVDAQAVTATLLTHSARTDVALNTIVATNNDKLDSLESFLTNATHKYYYHTSLYNEISNQVYDCHKQSQSNIAIAKHLESMIQSFETLTKELNHRELQANQAVIDEKRLDHDLQQKIKESSTIIAQHRQEIAKLQEANSAMVEKTKLIENILMQVEQATSKHRQDTQHIQSLHDQTVITIKQLETQRDELSTDNSNVEEHIHQLNLKIESLEDVCSSSEQEISQLQKLHSICENYHQKVLHECQLIQKLIAKTNDTEQHIQSLNEQLQTKQQCLTDRNQCIQDLQQALESSKSNLVSLQTQLDTMPSLDEIKQRASQLKPLEQRYDALIKERDQRQKDSELVEQHNAAVLDQLKRDLEATVNKFNVIVTEEHLEDKLKNAREELIHLESQGQEKTSMLAKITTDLEHLQTNHQNFVSQLEAQILEVESQLDDEHNERKLISELNNRRKEVASRRNELEASQNQLELLRKLIESKESSIASSEEIKSVAENEVARMKKMQNIVQQHRDRIESDIANVRRLQHEKLEMIRIEEEKVARQAIEKAEAERQAAIKAEEKRKAKEEEQKAKELIAAAQKAQEELENARKLEAEAKHKAREKKEQKRRAEEERRRQAEEAKQQEQQRKKEEADRLAQEAEDRRKQEADKKRQEEFAAAQLELKVVQDKADASLKRKQAREAARNQREIVAASRRSEQERIKATQQAVQAMVSPGGSTPKRQPLRSSLKSSSSKSKNASVSFNDESLEDFQSPFQDQARDVLASSSPQLLSQQQFSSQDSLKVTSLFHNVTSSSTDSSGLDDENCPTTNSQSETTTPDMAAKDHSTIETHKLSTASHSMLTKTPGLSSMFKTGNTSSLLGRAGLSGPRNVIGLGGLVPQAARSTSIFKRVSNPNQQSTNPFGKR